MSNILYIFLALVVFGLIVTVHEFGHYIVGRLCGIGVVEFSVGFGPKIISFKRKETLYSLRLIPLGGFCLFVGEDSENPAPNAMNKQPVWKRFLTILAGPGMNFLMALLFCLVLLCNYMVAEYLPRFDSIYPDTPAAECGLMAGDILLEINDTTISYDTEGTIAARNVIQSADKSLPLDINVLRGEDELHFQLTPTAVTDPATGENVYQIGVVFSARTYTLPEAFRTSFSYMKDFVNETIDAIKILIVGSETEEVDLIGPVGIISLISDVIASSQMYMIVYLVFMLSLNLCVMNLLPLPALDGSKLVFLIIEAIRRKPIPPEKEGMVHAIGLSLLLALVLFITYKDIIRLFFGG